MEQSLPMLYRDFAHYALTRWDPRGPLLVVDDTAYTTGPEAKPLLQVPAGEGSAPAVTPPGHHVPHGCAHSRRDRGGRRGGSALAGVEVRAAGSLRRQRVAHRLFAMRSRWRSSNCAPGPRRTRCGRACCDRAAAVTSASNSARSPRRRGQQSVAELGAKQDVIDTRLHQVRVEMRTELEKLRGMVAGLAEQTAQRFGRSISHCAVTPKSLTPCRSRRRRCARPSPREKACADCDSA